MATILGIAASIIAIIQLTERAATLSYRYTSGVKQAPVHFQSLLDELDSLSKVLATLHDSAKARPGSTELGKLSDHDGPLRGCILELEKLHGKLQPKVGWGRIINRFMWPLKEKETFDMILRIERYKNLFMLAINADQLSLRIEEKRMKALNWVYPEAFDKRHLEISGRRQPDTGQWILRAPEIQGWAKTGSNPQIIWGYGIPGAGKTFLTSVVIDHFLDQASAENYGVAYVYFHYKEQGGQSPLCVLASLVKQLASQIQHLPEEIEDLYDNLARQHRRPTLEDLYTMLGVVSKAFARTFIICDALDEYEEEARQNKLLPLFHRMQRDGLNLFLTSREYPEDIQDSFRNSAKIRLWAKDNDIANYVEQKIEESTRAGRLNLQDECKAMIISELTNYAKGMFLIAHFHVEHLCRQPTVRQILEELEKIKNSSTEERPLDPIYDRAMGRLRKQPQNCVKLALEIFSWLVKARRTLTVRELQMAISVKQGQTTFDERDLLKRETLLDVCASLVTIDEKSDTVMLAHETVQEYLLTYSVIPEDADFKLAMACTTFLSLSIFAQGSGACTSATSLNTRYFWYPFLLYAAQNVSYHLQSCHEDCTMELVLRFLARPSSISTYLQTLHAPRHFGNESGCFDWYPKRRTSLHVAASLGHCSAVRLLSERIGILARDDKGRTALHLAAFEGHHLVVRVLLEKGADISVWDMKGQTALHKAAYQRHLPVVKVLLGSGADPSVADKDGRIPLHQAAQEGNEPMVRLLLGKSSGTSIATALCLDATQKYESVVRLLVAKCVDISTTDRSSSPSWGVLHTAAIQGHELVVRLLLERGVDPSATDCHRRSVLGLAVLQGNEAMVKLLLEKGAKPSSELHLAAAKGNESIVRMLLETGADPSALDMDGRTALYRALSQGCYPSIYRELNQGPYPNCGALSQRIGYKPDTKRMLQEYTDTLSRSRLTVAGGNESIFKLLLEFGADLSVADKHGWTVLIHAAYHGIETVVRLLLKNGADVSVADGEGQTALHQAATGGHESVVKLLLLKGAKISARDWKGQTALHRAANGGHEPVVKMLLEKGVDISITDRKFQTALHWAAYGGRKLVVKLLIREGADISATDGKGQTALHWAAKGGHDSVVKLLLRGGAEISAADGMGQTALHLASIKGHESTVKLLLERGADLSVVDNDGWNPRLRASSQGYYTIARLFLERELSERFKAS